MWMAVLKWESELRSTCGVISACCWTKAEWLAIQDQQGEPKLALHYGWLPGDTVELAKLEHPRVTPRYPRRVVWQKDLCSDGKHRVTGADACPST